MDLPYARSLDVPGKRYHTRRRAASASGRIEQAGTNGEEVQAAAQEHAGESKYVLDTGGDPAALRSRDGRSAVTLDPGERARQPSQHGQIPAASRRLHRIVEAVDGVLLARTQMRHLLETLRNSRGFLIASLEELDAKLPVQRVDDVSTVLPPIASSPKTASNVTVQDQEAGSLREAGTAKYAKAELDASPTFSALVKQYREDMARLREQEVSFTTALDTLSDLEYRLNENQKSLISDLRDPDKAMRLLNQTYNDTVNDSELHSSNKSPTDLPSVVEECFERRGDVGIWSERLQELEEAFAEGVAEREFISDRGDPLDVTDQDFFARYQERREHIENELKIAKADSQRLEERCIEAGHDLETYRTARRRDTASDFSFSELLTASRSPVLNPIREISLASRDPSGTNRQPTRRVDSWLRTVETGVVASETSVSAVPDSPRYEDALPPSNELPHGSTLANPTESGTPAETVQRQQEDSKLPAHSPRQSPLLPPEMVPDLGSSSGLRSIGASPFSSIAGPPSASPSSKRSHTPPQPVADIEEPVGVQDSTFEEADTLHQHHQGSVHAEPLDLAWSDP